MRKLLVIFAWALAGPALAQAPPVILPPAPVPNPVIQPQYNELLAQQELARQQAIAQQNQLMSLEAQIKAQQALESAPGLKLPDHIAPPYMVPGAPPPKLDAGQLASIPDSKLAESNRKVLEASQPPR